MSRKKKKTKSVINYHQTPTVDCCCDYALNAYYKIYYNKISFPYITSEVLQIPCNEDCNYNCCAIKISLFEELLTCVLGKKSIDKIKEYIINTSPCKKDRIPWQKVYRYTDSVPPSIANTSLYVDTSQFAFIDLLISTLFTAQYLKHPDDDSIIHLGKIIMILLNVKDVDDDEVDALKNDLDLFIKHTNNEAYNFENAQDWELILDESVAFLWQNNDYNYVVAQLGIFYKYNSSYSRKGYT